ncbi:hypothetical protein [Chthonomonas calidirosea]|uniref:hypothetical protein n=1 Tax=Chthonomonas calidirosea TaxID=454171 RepID=UPI0012E3AA6B|nr:hypothetical protein [Chthonomonas calidirosea]
MIASYFINSWRGEISVWQGGLCIESLLSTVRLPWDEVLDVVERNIGNKNEPTLLILTTKGWLSLPAQSEEAQQLKSHLLNHLKRDHPIPHDRSRGNPPSYLLNTIRFISLLMFMSSVTFYIINKNFNPEFVSISVNLELVIYFVSISLVCVLASLVLLWEFTTYPLRSYGNQRDVFHLSSLVKEIFRMKRLRKTFSDLLLSPHNHPRTLLAVYKALALRVLAAYASDDVRKIDEKTRRSLHKLLRSETDPEFLCAFLQSYRPLVVPSDAPVMEALVQGKTALGYHAEVAQEAQTCLDVIRELTNPQTLLRAGTLTSEHLLRPVSNPTPAENLLRSVTNPSETLEEDRKEPLTPATRLQAEPQEQAAS